MEAKGCSQRWKLHLPEFKHCRKCPSVTARGSERGRTEGDRAQKNVTMASTSRRLTDRRYITRKPLFAEEPRPSILKKTRPQEHTEKEKQFGTSRREEKQRHADMSFSTGLGEDLTPETFTLSHLDSPLGVSELRTRLGDEEPSFVSPPPGLTSSFLEVQRLKPPLRPQLTSTVLHPTYTPRSGFSRPGQTKPRLETTLRSSGGGHSKGHPMSPYQANYWACAIPNASPPSTDRHSAGWDPNREYQALLDYTYPLRPGQESTSTLQGDTLLHLQDSGIDLDYLCSSSSLTGLDSLSGGHRSCDLQGFTRSSGGPTSGTALSVTDPVGLSLDSLDCSNNTGGVNHHRCDGGHHQHRASSTCLLPQSWCVCRDVDEEFRPLPEQLEELQLLSRQVREVTAQLSRPVTASWESLEPGTSSILSSITLTEEQEEEEPKVKETKDSGAERRAAQAADDLRDSAAVTSTPGSWVKPVGRGLREVEALVEQLSGLSLPGSQEQQEQQEHQEHSDSLMRHIQVFCSHLETLIQQLYAVSEKMELLAAPTVDMDSVKTSLAEYQRVHREVSGHRPLASCVLHSGRLLLSCINTMSPFLRDTLLMIERQGGVLESHTQHFFSSILSAMDSLTQPSQPSPAQQSPDPISVMARGSIS